MNHLPSLDINFVYQDGSDKDYKLAIMFNRIFIQARQKIILKQTNKMTIDGNDKRK